MASSEQSAQSGEPPVPDSSQLRSPLELGATGLKQLLQCYQAGTDEVRDTLMQECDVIIECKVCRSLYRGLPNFIAHKRHYCKKNYSGSLLRFQDLPTKEDEMLVFGSSMFAPRDPSGAFYDSIVEIQENIDKVRSTDSSLQLDFLENTNVAVGQTLGTVRDSSEEPTNGPTKKRKAEDQLDEEQPSKAMKFEIEETLEPGEQLLDGIFIRPTSLNVHNLKQFYVYHHLKPEGKDRCLKCKQDFATIKTLRSHFNRIHLQRRMFHQCKKCQKVFLLRKTFTSHLVRHHSCSVSVARDHANHPTLEKIVIDKKVVCNIPSSGFKQVSSVQKSLDDPGDRDESNVTEAASSSPKKVTSKTESGPLDDSIVDEINEDLASDGQGELNKFCLEMIRCLAIFRIGNKAPQRGMKIQRYKCMKHPSIVFKHFTSGRDHIIQKHCCLSFKCPICKESFNSRSPCYVVNFAKHLRDHHHVTLPNLWPMRDALQRCLLRTPAEAGEFEVEMLETSPITEEKAKPYECPICRKQFELSKSIGQHMLDKHEVTYQEFRQEYAAAIMPMFECPKCRKRYESTRSIKRHLMAHHDIAEDKYYRDYHAIVKALKPLRQLGSPEKTTPTPKPPVQAPARDTPKPTVEDTKQKNENPRRGIRDRDGTVVSIFNLEDLFCPVCAKGYPRMKMVINHLQKQHGFDAEKAVSFKDKIKKSSVLYKERMILNVSAPHVSSVDSNNDDGSAEGTAEFVTLHENKRKQLSPAKSQMYLPRKTNGQFTDKQLITFKSGFSLRSCSKCNKIFGKKAALLNHEESCVAAETPELSENESEADPQQKPMIPSPERRGIYRRHRCAKCKRTFRSKGAVIAHEKSCMAGEEWSEDMDSDRAMSDDEEDVSMISQDRKPDIKCDRCKKDFKARSGLVIHMKTCSVVMEGSETCESDDTEYKDLKSEANDMGVCSSAPKASSTPAGPSVLRVLLQSPLPCTTCANCRRIFSTKKALLAHQEQCDITNTEESEIDSISTDVPLKEPIATSRIIDLKAVTGKSSSIEISDDEADETKKEPAQESFQKIYKCPLCDFEDLELPKISHHLVAVHDWSSAKVAARRDTLKRSIILKSATGALSPRASSPSVETSSPSSLLSRRVSQVSSVASDDKTPLTPTEKGLLPAKFYEYACTFCAKTYAEMWQLKCHWQVVHGIDKNKSLEMKKEIEEEKRKHLIQLQSRLRTTRRSGTVGGDTSDTPDSAPSSLSKSSPRKTALLKGSPPK